MELHLVAERDHRRFPRIRRQQLRKENAAAAELVDDGSGVRAGLYRDHQVDGIHHPIHVYRLRHIVVVENQVRGRQPVHVASFGIRDGGGCDYQGNRASELRPSSARKQRDSRGNTHWQKGSSFWANPLLPLRLTTVTRRGAGITQGETDLGRKVGERASSLIRALPAKTAVGEDDCLANDVVAEAPAAE